MKIAILTQPLRYNYGGLLQAWALQHKLANTGHEVIIINRVHNPVKVETPLWYRCLSRIKNEIYIFLGKRKRYLKVTNDLREISEQKVKKFQLNRYKGVSPEIRTHEDLVNFVSKQNFDVYIVGSDQVWRPKYSPNLMTYFLDFVKDDNKVKKIAYAASFGVDNWELTSEETKEASELIPLFDLVTVRESSGVEFLKKYFKCEATQVLDPTMLLDKEDYIKLIENSTCELHDSNGNLFCYVLDKAEDVDKAIQSCSSSTGLHPYYCNSQIRIWQIEGRENIEKSIFPPVEQWLKSFVDAKMVVTDSFHGVVFSIIFNKPFWVIANINRGAARFTSILNQFNLENRIISNLSDIDWEQPIDWNSVNKHRSLLKNKSLSLLLSQLKD